MSARRSPPALHRPAPKPRTSPPPSPSSTSRCRRWSMRWPRATSPWPAQCRSTLPNVPALMISFGDNLFQERTIAAGDIEAAARAAEITVTREYRMNRQSGAPMECRGVLAYRDHRLDEVVVYASTQTPHTMRVALGEFLGIEERRIRVVAPDVGGGFGPKARLYPEEIVLAALALELDHPVRWIEDRNEHLLTAAHTPRPSLPGHRLCRPAGPYPRHRLRDHRRCRRLWACGRKARIRKPTWRRAACRGPIRSRTTAPAPPPSRPTRRRSVRIAASAAPAPALRSSARSTRSPARSAAIRSRCASRT